MSINLLQDREAAEKNGKKKKGSQNFELTDPQARGNQSLKQAKKGGLLEFFKKITQRAPKVKIQSKEEIEKKASDVVERKRPKHKWVVEEEGLTPPRQSAEKKDFAPKLFRRPQTANEVVAPKFSDQPEPVPKRPEREGGPPPVERVARPQASKKARMASSAQKKEFEETEPDIPPPSDEPVLDVNLIPEEIRAKLEPKRKIRIFVVSMVICLLTILISGGGMIWYQKNIEQKIEDVRAETQLVKSDIAKFEAIRQTGEELSAKISSAEEIMNSHIYWTQFLAELENYTLPDVYYKSLAANIAGTVTLVASAKDLQTLANQYVIFQNAEDFVESVEIYSAIFLVAVGEGQTGSVAFTATLSVNPEIFYFDERGAK